MLAGSEAYAPVAGAGDRGHTWAVLALSPRWYTAVPWGPARVHKSGKLESPLPKRERR